MAYSPTKTGQFQYGSPQIGYYSDYQEAVNAANQTNRQTQQQRQPTVAGLSQQVNNLLGQLDDPTIRRLYDSLPDQLKSTYNQVVGSVVKRIDAGQVVNPDIKLSPKDARKLLREAESQIDPYYQEVLGQYSQDFERSIGRLEQDYQTYVQRQQEAYGQARETQAETEASAGTAFSSGREERQRQLATKQENLLQDVFSETQRSAEDIARLTERDVGSDYFSDLSRPSITQYGVNPEGFSVLGSRRLAAPTGGVTGEVQRQRKQAIEGRRGQLEANFRLGRNLDLRPLY